MMIELKIPSSEADAVLDEERRPCLRRRPHSEFDFGDDGTVGLELKLADKGIADPDIRFAKFCGKGKLGYYVVRYKFPGWEPEAIEVFDTEAEMKQRWRLD